MINKEEENKQKKRIFSILKHIPRSQAIYGSLVETFGPYSQNYTTYHDIFIFYIPIVTVDLLSVNKKTEHFFMFGFNRSYLIIPTQSLQVV